MGNTPKQDKRAEVKERRILNSIRTKVIFGFLLLAMALTVSWLVVHFTVNEMNAIVDRMFVPNPKLTLAEEIFGQVVQLEQTQKVKALENPNLSPEELLAGSAELRAKLDTLLYWVTGNEHQVRRVDSMYRILDQWDGLLISYTRLRAEMSSNKELAQKINELSQLMSARRVPDSSVVTTEKKITTTTYIPETTSETQEEETLFERLFGKNEEKAEIKVPPPNRIVKKELDISIDTILSHQTDSVIEHAVSVMGELKKDQTVKNVRLVRQEYALLNSSGEIVRTLLKLSHDIQEEEVRLEKAKNRAKMNMLQEGISRYTLLIFLFIIGAAVLVFLIFFDVSKSNHYRLKLKEAKEEAVQLSQVKQRFLANMSHEIRTPLQSIIGFSEQLIRHREKSCNKAINAIYHSSHHLLQVVNEVLDYSQISSNKLQLNNQPFDMGKELYEVVAAVSQQCEQKGISFDPVIPMEELQESYFFGDAFRLKQILYNLLGNAVKFTNRGKVTFSVEHEDSSGGSSFVFRITDSGIGISEKDKQRIFQQFERLNYNRAPQDGIGLGLSIVQALVREKGGEIEVNSQPNQGSTFVVKLFYPQAEKPLEFSLPPARPEDGAFPEKVIIIDDDPFIRELCGLILARHHVDFTTYASAEEFLACGWKAVTGTTIFLIDIRLPGITGETLSRHLRKDSGKNARIIAMTAHFIGEKPNQQESDYFDDVLMKPFTEDQLFMILMKRSSDQSETPDMAHSAANDIPDLSNLYRMAGQDAVIVRSFLKRFGEDSSKDSKALTKALDNEDLSTAVELIHRLAGRCGQLGAHALAAAFRKFEVVLRTDGAKINYHALSIRKTVERLEQMLEYLNKNLHQVSEQLIPHEV